MSAYVLVDCDVTDPVRYEEYRQLAPAAIAKYGGRYLVRGGATKVLEGTWQPKRDRGARIPGCRRRAAILRFARIPRRARSARRRGDDERHRRRRNLTPDGVPFSRRHRRRRRAGRPRTPTRLPRRPPRRPKPRQAPPRRRASATPDAGLAAARCRSPRRRRHRSAVRPAAPSSESGVVAPTSGVVSDSVMRGSMRRPGTFHSPHQSSSRTVGQTPSIMYDLVLTGLSIGAVRRHCPHWMARLSPDSLPDFRS